MLEYFPHCADQKTNSMKKNRLWDSYLNRDDRDLLNKIENANRSQSVVRDLLHPFINSAIRALHFSRSNRVGVTVPEDSLEFMTQQFLKWLNDKDEWGRLTESWKKSKGPWSLPYFIFRSYYRFRRENFPQGVKGEVSFSGQRSFLELDGTCSGLTVPILEAFSFVTQALPETLRLHYQLHLEGLLNAEIATLLNVSEKEVKEKIVLAKEYLDSDEPNAEAG